MKRGLFVAFIATLFSTQLIANTQTVCPYQNSYKDSGWVVHSSSSFAQYARLVEDSINEGLQNGRVEPDLSGIIKSRSGSQQRVIMLQAVSYDDLATPRDEMYGDYSLLTTLQGEKIAEVRWYDGRNRNIVFNEKYLRCFSHAAPWAFNSVL